MEPETLDITEKELFEKLLDRGKIQIMCSSNRQSGIVIPDHLYAADEEFHPHNFADHIERFNLSWRFEAPMEIRDDGIEATLRFGGEDFECWFPWSCLVGVVTNDNYRFAIAHSVKDMNQSVILPLDGKLPEDREDKPARAPHLRLVH